MYSLLLALIYIVFIGLGLPDSILGSAWPEMQATFDVPLGHASIITMLISLVTVVSTLLSVFFSKKLGTGLLVTISVSLTAIAIIGFSFSTHFWMLIVFTLPYGLGAGAIDSTLNNYVVTHYSSKHMHWLNCFWGVGAAIGPFLMSLALGAKQGWQGGYRLVGIVQLSISVLLFLSLPLWRLGSKQRENTNLSLEKQLDIKTQSDTPQYNPNSIDTSSIDQQVQSVSTCGDDNTADAIETSKTDASTTNTKDKTTRQIYKKQRKLTTIFKTKGVAIMLISFLTYCSLENITGLWASSYFVIQKGTSTETAALFGVLFFIGITVGRFISGFVANKLGDKNIIRVGIAIAIVGVVALLLPIDNNIFALSGLIVIGLGCSPIFPAMLHATPTNFGTDSSQKIISLQIACAYLSSLIVQPIFGAVANTIGIFVYPFVLLLFIVIVAITSERLNKVVNSKKFATQYS